MGNNCLQCIVLLNPVWPHSVQKRKNRKTRAAHSSECYTLRKPHSCEIVLPRTEARGSGHHKIHIVFSIPAHRMFHIILTRMHFVDTSASVLAAKVQVLTPSENESGARSAAAIETKVPVGRYRRSSRRRAACTLETDSRGLT